MKYSQLFRVHCSRAFVLVFAASLMGLLAGCGPMEEATEGEEVSRPTSEQIEETLSNTPEPDESMLLSFASACPSTTTNSCINAGYASCAAWTTYSNCSSATCNPEAPVPCSKYVCDPEGGCDWEWYNVRHQGRTRYRVCWNAAGGSCTEYDTYYQKYCDCP